MPDPAHRALLWTSLGSPGALLSGIDIAGTWRATQQRRVLDVEVRPFRPLGGHERAELEHEAQRLATVRGLPDQRLRVS